MNEKIEEIRKRHVKASQTPSDWWTVMGDDANRDRHTLLAEVDRLRAEVERLRQPTPKRPILGQEAIAGRDGLGRVTEIGPHNPVTDQPEWIGVTPYAGRTWQMNYAPHNVSLVHIRVETNL